MAVFVDTFEAVTGESLPPRKSDTSQLQYLASAVGGVETLLRCMCLYVDRFRHVNAYTVHGYFTDPEYRRLRRRLGGFAEEINRLRMRVAKGEMVRPTTPVRAATGVAPGPWWGTAHNGTAWAEVPQAWIDWQLEVVRPRDRVEHHRQVRRPVCRAVRM
jgi:hypothetical protein